MPFPLPELQPALLEKIFSKLEWKGYFRLQQSCRDMEGFPRTSRNIHVSLPKTWFLLWIADESGKRQLRYVCGSIKKGRPCKRPQDVYGVQFAELRLELDTTEEFEELCSALRKCRITCSFLSLHLPSHKISLTNDQCEELLKILKPINLAMDSNRSNQFEVLFRPQKMKEVCVLLDPENVLAVMEKCLPTFESVQIICHRRCSPEGQFRLLDSILQFLYFDPPVNLRSLRIEMRWSSADGMLERLRHSHPTLEKESELESNVDCIMAVPSEAYCGLNLCFCSTEIYFKPKCEAH